MKRIIPLLLLLGTLPVCAEPDSTVSSVASQEAAPQGQPKKPSKPVMSRRCGIYSGVCLMVRKAEVGAYCVCPTAHGMVHGVVVP